jgi:hypothetical protein
LRVTSEGFQAYQQTGVSVTINNVTQVDVTLDIGQITETVTVSATAATLWQSQSLKFCTFFGDFRPEQW